MKKAKRKVVTEVKRRELGEYEFYCGKCKTVHAMCAYAIAQRAMGVEMVFTCGCGNKINL